MKTNLIATALIASFVMASCGGGENSTLTEGLSALNKELDSISKAEEEKKNAPYHGFFTGEIQRRRFKNYGKQR
ncbi:MAG: hypothetical protein LW750_06800 [Bacteroidetes bacterium]|nr:hypothetical protein [Bacteroidota bacterium]